jgi:hypothetical protein
VLTVLSKNIGPMTRVPDTARQTPIFFGHGVAAHAEREGSPPPNTAGSENLLAGEMKPRLITHYVLERV